MFTKTKVRGRENIPRKGPFIITINHFSYVDPIFVIHAIQKPISFLAASDQKIKWYFIWAPFIYGFIPTNRKVLAPSTIKHATRALKSNEILGVFPEGTSTSSKLRPGKNGAVYLSALTESRMLPIGVFGLENVWKQLFRGVKPKVTINIGRSFGPFLLPKNRKKKEGCLLEIGNEAMCRIAALLPKEQRGVFTSNPKVTQFYDGVDF
jgi:1-acyl-sn-glycerol-3-phosphate acyltransferase